MRNYLYLWNEPSRRMLVASGLEFRDLHPLLPDRGGVILIKHDAADFACYDEPSRFHYVPAGEYPKLAEEDIYSWGDYAWVDYSPGDFPCLSRRAIAEICCFGHMLEPMSKVSIPGLGNRVMVWGHDDGWRLRLFYANWRIMRSYLARIIPARMGPLDLSKLRQGKHAYWLEGGKSFQEEITEDIDAVLNRRTTSTPSRRGQR